MNSYRIKGFQPKTTYEIPLIRCSHRNPGSSFTKSPITKYADDIVTVLPITKDTDMIAVLTDEIEHLKIWGNKNGL